MGGDKSAGEINDAQVERDVARGGGRAVRPDRGGRADRRICHGDGARARARRRVRFTPTSSTCPSGSPATRTRALRRSRSRSGPTRPGPFGSATVATIPAAPEDDVASGLLGSWGAVWRRAHACLGWFQRVVRALHMALQRRRGPCARRVQLGSALRVTCGKSGAITSASTDWWPTRTHGLSWERPGSG